MNRGNVAKKQQVALKGKNKVVTRVSDDVKLDCIEKLIRMGFNFGGVVRDDSVKGVVEANLIWIDEGGNGYEIKFRSSQFAIYTIVNGYSKNRDWVNYSDFDNVITQG